MSWSTGPPTSFDGQEPTATAMYFYFFPNRDYAVGATSGDDKKIEALLQDARRPSVLCGGAAVTPHRARRLDGNHLSDRGP